MSQGTTPIVEADKGYDSEELRLQILALKLFPYIPHRRISRHTSELSVKILEKHRWKVERGILLLLPLYLAALMYPHVAIDQLSKICLSGIDSLSLLSIEFFSEFDQWAFSVCVRPEQAEIELGQRGLRPTAYCKRARERALARFLKQNWR